MRCSTKASAPTPRRLQILDSGALAPGGGKEENGLVTQAKTVDWEDGWKKWVEVFSEGERECREVGAGEGVGGGEEG